MKILLILGLFTNLFKRDVINHNYLDNQIDISVSNFIENYEDYQKENYFNGESKEEIAKKLDKYLNSTLKGKGMFITEYSLSIGMDPYLAAAVILQESGCQWTCSSLVRYCNNVGGNKGNPGCNGGSYRKFNSIDEGIKFAINKLNSYYKKGITNPKEINKYYAESKTWYIKVNNYINKLKNE